jgi:hypothetical protein
MDAGVRRRSLRYTVIALPLGVWGLALASTYLLIPMPVDQGVIALTLLAAAGTAVGIGLLPAMRVSAQHPVNTLTSFQAVADGTPAQGRGRRFLVMVQVALSLGLLATGTQLVSIMRSLGAKAGTNPNSLLMASFDVGQLKLSAAETDAFY